MADGVVLLCPVSLVSGIYLSWEDKFEIFLSLSIVFFIRRENFFFFFLILYGSIFLLSSSTLFGLCYSLLY